MATASVTHYPLRISGEAVDTDALYEIVNPATEEVFATAAKGSVAHADDAVAAAKAAHERGEWRTLPPAERADVLDAICARMSEQMDELCAQECGLPPGVLNVITGEGEEVGAHLAAHPDVRKIAFTGSTAVGREIMRTAAGNVKRVTLELGGKGPNVVLDDADLETAVDAALFACYLYSGQACESGTRLLLPPSLHDEFVDRMVALASNMVVGDPADFGTDIGPVISAAQRDRILGYIEQGRRQGATVALGGGAPDHDKGFWVQPTIFTGVTNDMTIAREEIFGPVISVLEYDTGEDASRIANDTPLCPPAADWQPAEGA